MQKGMIQVKKRAMAVTAAVVFGTSLLIAGASGTGGGDKAYANAFSDVKESDWFYEDVRYAREYELMSGTSESEFSPMGSTTRGMIVTILWRLENKPDGSGVKFDDVAEDAYYHDAVIWAASNKIVSGYSDTEFGPNDTATREQFAAIMHRYAAYKGYDTSGRTELDKYADKGQISDYALDSIKWANETGLITGTSDTTISPKDNVQRCQAAAILKRFCLNFAENKDTDESEETIEEIEIAETSGSESLQAEDVSSVNSPEEGLDERTENVDYGIAEDSLPDAAEALSPEIVVDNVEASPGEEVQMAVSVKNNPGILGMTLTMYYDEEKCTLISAESGAALNDVLDFTPSKTLNSGVRFLWDGIEISDEEVKDGDILLLTFKVSENAEHGICPITVKYFDEDIVANDLSGIYPYVKNGQILIK